MRYRNISGHPEDLDGGRVVGTGEKFDLSDKELESDYNKQKIEEGKFIALKNQPQEQAPVKLSKKDRDALLGKAQELEVENPENLSDGDLVEAVKAAEAEKHQEGEQS
jgi:hypothetical protein